MTPILLGLVPKTDLGETGVWLDKYCKALQSLVGMFDAAITGTVQLGWPEDLARLV